MNTKTAADRLCVRRLVRVAVPVLLSVAALAAVLLTVAADGSGQVSGVVVDADGPVAGAVVRQQATRHSTTSAADGSFTLTGLEEGTPMVITAWSEGHYPGGLEVVPPQSGVTITMRFHPAGDNPDYEWLTSMPEPGVPLGCGHCMVAFPDWEHNAHAGAGRNPRFFSLYNGTNLSGTAPVAPGYRLDFPGTAGNCAACHAPGAAVDAPYATDMNTLQGVDAEGVFCDYCHKIGYAYLNPATNLPYPNAPGVVSYRLYRPPPDTHMFFGPFDDVTRRVSYLALEKKSQFCAGCHQFSFWGTPIYESYREWLESPYPAQGVECQGCHMVPTGVDYFVYPEQGGLIREPELIASHLQPGAADVELLQNTVTMTLAADQALGRLVATVTITNTGAGHHVPTDFPGRHMLLVVSAAQEGRPLSLLEGPVVPEWGGDLAGQPGQGYAKLLRDVASGEWPVVSYWKQTLIVADTRLAALESDRSVYAFAAPAAGGPVTVTAELRFRRAFQGVMDDKGWETPDIVMETAELALAARPYWLSFLPVALVK